MASNNQEAIVRNVANFGPDIWGDLFTSFILDKEVMKTYNTEVEVMKEEVRGMLVSAAVGAGLNSGATLASIIANQMSLIDTIERLGLAFHFEKEIEQRVEHMFTDYNIGDGNNFLNDYDLFAISLHFRIFRQHGHRISSSMFSKFTDANGKFKENLSMDVLGMLSLYEASHLRIHGEEILEEAFYFTATHLKKLSDGKLIKNPLLANQVEHALVQPLHRGLPRMEAKYYISIYQQLDAKNDMLLKFARLDFNRLQLLYKQEIGDITRWWKDVLSAAKVSHVRDRAVDGYFCCAAIFDAPEYSLARSLLTKFFIAMTIIDDTYDAYGTYEELQSFTQAWLRWDAEAVNLLPDYMKPIYTSVRKAFASFESDLTREGRSYGAPYAVQQLKQMVECYDVETKWLREDYVPTFDEYIAYRLPTSMNPLHTVSFLGVGEDATIEAFEWVASNPKIVIASSVIARILNDIAGHEHEHQRKHIPTALDCYMKEYNISIEEARQEMHKMIESNWKDINEEMLRPIPVPMHLLMPILNLLRGLGICYTVEADGFTKPEKLEHLIRALYVDPIPSGKPSP